MISTFRLSRISHPRATLWAMALLVIVFLGFGVWAEACLPDAPAAAPTEPAEHRGGESWVRDLRARF